MPTPPMAVPARAGNPTWRIDANCRGGDAERFFAPSHVERKQERLQREAAARDLCRRCPVNVACLEYALTVQEPHGIWGGHTENERRRLMREQAPAGRPRAVELAPDMTIDLTGRPVVDITDMELPHDHPMAV